MVKSLIPWKRRTESLSPERAEARHPYAQLHRQVNELFDDFVRGFGGGRWPSPLGGPEGWSLEEPRFEVSETDDEIRVKAELPGMEEKDIEVTLDENLLTIRGEKREDREDKHRNYVFSEVRYGQFHRVVPLPAGVDQEKAKARFKRGVLTLTLPKLAGASSRRRRIQVGSD